MRMENKKTSDVCGPKVRTDSWAAKLTPDQQWKLYRKAKESDDWLEALEWAKAELRLDASPSRSAFFNWMSTMRQLECEQRMEEIAIAAAIGKKVPDDEAIIAAFKMLAVEAGAAGDAKSAGSYARIADTFQNMRKKQRDFKRDEAEYKVRQEEDMAMKHSKRKIYLADLSQKLGKPPEEAAEQYRKANIEIRKLTDYMFEDTKEIR